MYRMRPSWSRERAPAIWQGQNLDDHPPSFQTTAWQLQSLLGQNYPCRTIQTPLLTWQLHSRQYHYHHYYKTQFKSDEPAGLGTALAAIPCLKGDTKIGSATDLIHIKPQAGSLNLPVSASPPCQLAWFSLPILGHSDLCKCQQSTWIHLSWTS